MFDVKRTGIPICITFTQEIEHILSSVDNALHEFELHAFITSGCDGVHLPNSKHFTNQALDFRIVWSPGQGERVLQSVTRHLGKMYKVKLESDHLHVEAI